MNPLARYLDPEVIQQVGRLDLRARFIVEGFLSGLHSSPLQGLSVEFSEHRKYTKGDEPRTIDWKVYARTDRLFVRKYEAETHLACHLLVDTSASMGHVGLPDTSGKWPPGSRKPTTTKLDYAIHIAAALGYLITQQQDSVGLALIGDGLEQMLPARGRRKHLVDLLATLSAVQPQGITGLSRGVSEALVQIPHRGLVVLLSDLLADTEATLETIHQIRFRGHDLIVMHILDAAEAQFTLAGSVQLEDPETGDYLTVDAAAVRRHYLDGIAAWRKELDDQVTAARADYVPLDTSQPFDRALIEFLIQRQRRR